MSALFRDLNLARADGSLGQLLKRLNRIDVLAIDDWAMAPMAESERRDFWEIAEDRYQTCSIILTSQLPVARWHEQIGDPTLADSILDRLVHKAHRIERLRCVVSRCENSEVNSEKSEQSRLAGMRADSVLLPHCTATPQSACHDIFRVDRGIEEQNRWKCLRIE